jgi:hypothetical protein
MKKVIVVLFALALAITATAAPAPLGRHERPNREPNYPTPGLYLIKWGSCTEKPGELTTYNTGWYWYYTTKYYFIWEFDRESRVFHMWEVSENRRDAMDLIHKELKAELTHYSFNFVANKFETPPYYPGTTLSMKRIK